MDGNNRWSKINKINLSKSYKAGAEKLFKIVDHCFFYHKINYVSAFALSSHNLSRPKNVLLPIMKLLDFYLDELLSNTLKYKYNIRFIGNFEIFKKETVKKLLYINNQNKFSKTLIIALNYSGSDDIIRAANLLKNNKLKFPDLLSTAKYPNPDLLIRTGGYQRLSDFFLFQMCFTEFFFLKTLWPNLKTKSVDIVIDKYLKIERKFGK